MKKSNEETLVILKHLNGLTTSVDVLSEEVKELKSLIKKFIKEEKLENDNEDLPQQEIEIIYTNDEKKLVLEGFDIDKFVLLKNHKWKTQNFTSLDYFNFTNFLRFQKFVSRIQFLLEINDQIHKFQVKKLKIGLNIYITFLRWKTVLINEN